MKVILINEVTGLGTPGDIVEVKNGFGRNYLLPQGFAIPWTKGAEKDVTAIRKARKAREIATLDDAEAIRDSLQSKPVVVSAKAVVRKPKKKQNPLKAAKIDVVDYKDTALLRKFISDRGKIRARRVTGVSVQEQRAIARAVKNAREMALLPYSSSAR